MVIGKLKSMARAVGAALAELFAPIDPAEQARRHKATVAPPAPPRPDKRKRMRVMLEAVGRAAVPPGEPLRVWKMPKVAPGVIPNELKLAQDQALEGQMGLYSYALQDAMSEGLAFMGYPALAELAQRPEYRRATEILALEMTRKGIKLQSTGAQPKKPKPPEPPPGAAPGMPPGATPADPQQPPGVPAAKPAPFGGAADMAPPFAAGAAPASPKAPQTPGAPPAAAAAVPGAAAPGPGLPPGAPPEIEEEPEIDPKAEKLVKIEAELKRLDVMARLREATRLDGYFGRAHIFIDTGTEDPNELKLPLSETVEKLKLNGIKNLVVIEPVWTYPGRYNSTNPLKPDFYKPETWFVLGKEVHRSRLITIIGRPVPDMLKPAYAFGGLSLVQMMKPYVDNWLRTRQSVSDLLHAFTVMVLKTNMESVLSGEETDPALAAGMSGGLAGNVFDRVDLFNRFRDNRGTFVIDKDDEDFSNVSAPISGLDHLQAQSQEQMCSVSGIPLVKFTGITPSGLNASSDGEIRVFYDGIAAAQEADYREELERLIRLIQLCEFGEIDKEIGFIFNPLWSASESEVATTRKTEADTDAVYIDKGVLDPIEVRQRLATQPDSPYASIDVNAVPDPPAPPGGDPMMGGLPPGGPGDDLEGDDPPGGGTPSAAPTAPSFQPNVSRST